MKISFQIKKQDTLPELMFCWRMTIDMVQETAVSDIFIPELFYDFIYIQKGQMISAGATLPRQTVKTLYTQRLDLVLQTPLVLYGARFVLPFAELFWQKQMPANSFLEQDWLESSVPNLDSFTSQVVIAVTTRRIQKTIAPMFQPSLAETDWLAAYSPRHKRRLYKSVLGITQKELRVIQNVHQFLGQTCDFATSMPRIVEYVNADSFYDQPHLNNAFKKLTGLSPLAYFESNSILQDNLMAASYNEHSGQAGKIVP
jgi:AraC-like DNA-binding protein